MTRYYFHIRSEDVFEDDIEGMELPSQEAAHSEAVAGAREIVAERVRRGETIGDDAFEVTTDQRDVIFSLSLRSVLKLV